MIITVPELSLVLLIGPAGAGKSTFAKRHFKASEILSSDYCRYLVSDDENDQAATQDAFDVLHLITAKRLASGRLTVVDATNVQLEARKPSLALARQYYVPPIAIVLNLPERLCEERDRQRPHRNVGSQVIRTQAQDLQRSLKALGHEGFQQVYILDSPEEIDTVGIERRPLEGNRRFDHGPFDIIGDVHGCFDELIALLQNLGHAVSRADSAFYVKPPKGRKAVFLGDLVDRGPKTPDVLRLVMRMVREETALCVPGNHDVKLLRKLQGRDVRMTHSLADTLEQVDKEPSSFRQEVAAFLESLPSHYVLDDGKLVVAHAGLKEEMQGRDSGEVRDFALYGATTGEFDSRGLPIRLNWAAEYRGKATVVYGHTPVREPAWLNGTMNIDTGCAFGGRLTALRYPERELVSVPAQRTYYEHR